MTARYDRELGAGSRRPFLLVELDLIGCAHDVGVGACTVSPVPADGALCSHSFHTCGRINSNRDLEFTEATRTVRFVSLLDAASDLPIHLVANWGPALYPCLKKVSPVGQEVDVEAGFTRPDKSTLTFVDMGSATYSSDATFVDGLACPEFNVDKSPRNTSRSGLWFRRLVQQHPNLKGRAVRIFRGFLVPDWETTDCLEIWRGSVDNVSFSPDGSVSMSCSDALAGLDQALPPATDATLATDLSTETTSIGVRGVDQFTDPSTISGLVVVRSRSIWTGRYEYMTVTSLDVTGDSVLGALVVTRGTHGSQKEPHAKGQLLEEVFTTYSQDGLSGTTWPEIAIDGFERLGLDVSTYDAAQIRAAVRWTGSWQFKRHIPEEGADPEEKPFREVLFELLGDVFLGNTFIGNDLKLQALVSSPTDPTETVEVVTDRAVAAGSMRINLNEGGRLTSVVFHFGKVPGEDRYLRRVIATNGETTRDEYFPGRKTKIIKSDWLSSGQGTLAELSAVLRSNLFAFPPERIEWESELRAAPLSMGAPVSVSSFDVQDDLGAPRVHRGRIVKKEWDAAAAFVHLSQSTGYDETKRWGFIQENGLTDYDSATDAQRDAGAFLGEIFDGAVHATDDFSRADESPLAAPWGNLAFSGDEFDLVDERVTTKDVVFGTGPNFHAELTGATPFTANGYGWVQARVAYFGAHAKAGDVGVGGNYGGSFKSVHALLKPTIGGTSVEVVTGLGGARISHGGSVVPDIVPGRFYTLRLETSELEFRVYLDGLLAARITPVSFYWPYAAGDRRPSLLVENALDNALGWWVIDDLEAGEPLLDGVRVGSSLDPGYCII